MKNSILIILIFLFSVRVYSQNTTDKFLNELKQTKVDTVCVFEDYSIGSVQIFKNGNENDYCEFKFENIPSYIFWKNKGKTFLTKKDDCFEYSVVEIDAKKIWTYYFDNKKTIENEKIKDFQIEEIKNGKKTILNVGVDHSHHQNFKIIVNNEIIEKRLDDFDFQKFESSFNEKEININYEHNSNLKSKAFVIDINKLILKNISLLTKKRIDK